MGCAHCFDKNLNIINVLEDHLGLKQNVKECFIMNNKGVFQIHVHMFTNRKLTETIFTTHSNNV